MSTSIIMYLLAGAVRVVASSQDEDDVQRHDGTDPLGAVSQHVCACSCECLDQPAAQYLTGSSTHPHCCMAAAATNVKPACILSPLAYPKHRLC